MHGEDMNEVRDPFLSQLFADRAHTLDDLEFSRKLLVRIERAHRRQRAFTTGAVIAILGLVAFAAPWITLGVGAFTTLVTDGSAILELAARSPFVVIVALAIVVALAPTAYVWRLSR